MFEKKRDKKDNGITADTER